MKTILRSIAIFGGLICSLFAGAEDKGNVELNITAQDGTTASISCTSASGYGEIKASGRAVNGHFKLTVAIDAPGFYTFMNHLDSNNRVVKMYLTPGDNISLYAKDNSIIMSGKGSEVNQFYYDVIKKFDYSKTTSLRKVYDSRVKALNESTNADVIRLKANLLGYIQGEYLDKVYGAYLNSKLFGESDEIIKPKADYDINLVPEIMSYDNWRRLVTEMMFAKAEAGQVKFRNSDTWIVDFGKTISNEKMREEYIVSSLEFEVLAGTIVHIDDMIKDALPSIKDPKNIARIDKLQTKIAKSRAWYKNAMPGADMSAFTFQKPDGSRIAFSNYKGKVVFLDLWSTSCHPCIAEIPFLKKLEAEMHGKDVEFVSISCDNVEGLWQAFMKKRNLTGEQLLMKGMRDPFFETIGLSGIPRFVILDKEGKIVDFNCGKRPSNPLLKMYLNEILSK